ncbi:cupin domain-containing protein [Gemmatimonadota bacterium]
MQYVFDTTKVKRYRFPTHVNDLVMDRAQANVSEVFVVVLEQGEAPPPHVHNDTEQIFYILEGQGVLAVGQQGEEYSCKPGDIVRVPPGTIHTIRSVAGNMRYLAIDCFTSRRNEDEPTWDAHVRAVCQQQGWDYEDVVKSSE